MRTTTADSGGGNVNIPVATKDPAGQAPLAPEIPG